MGRGKFARTRGVLLKQTSKFAVVIGVLSIVGARAELARAAENGGSSSPPAQADAVNQALLKKMEAMEQRIRSLEAQVRDQNAPTNAGKPQLQTSPAQPNSRTNPRLTSRRQTSRRQTNRKQTNPKRPAINRPRQLTRLPIKLQPPSPTRRPISTKPSPNPQTNRYWASFLRQCPVFLSELTARCILALCKIRPPAASGRIHSMPAASCCCRHTQLPTTSFSTPRSSSSTQGLASTTTTNCMGRPRSSNCGWILSSAIRSAGAPRHRSCADRLHQSAPRTDPVL